MITLQGFTILNDKGETTPLKPLNLNFENKEKLEFYRLHLKEKTGAKSVYFKTKTKTNF